MTDEQKKSEGLKTVLLRNLFYRDQRNLSRFILLFVFALNILLALGAVYLWLTPVKPRYFAMTADGRLIKIHPLSEPVVSDNFVEQWSADAVRKTFMLDYVHWRAQLQDAAVNYTPDGWSSFVAALKASNNLKTLTTFNMVVDAKLQAAPQIVRKSVVSGEFAWNVQMPLLLTFEGPNKRFSIPMQVTLIVLRQPVQNYPQRIAINNFIAESQGGDVES